MLMQSPHARSGSRRTGISGSSGGPTGPMRRQTRPGMVGNSSGAIGPRYSRSGKLPSVSTSTKMATKNQSMARKVMSGMRTPKGMAGLGIGLGALAFTRNTGSASTKPQGRPTGMYQY